MFALRQVKRAFDRLVSENSKGQNNLDAIDRLWNPDQYADEIKEELKSLVPYLALVDVRKYKGRLRFNKKEEMRRFANSAILSKGLKVFGKRSVDLTAPYFIKG